MVRLYFDLVPDAVNENIVQYMSAKPNARKWRKFMRGEDIAALLEVYGDMERTSRSLFDSISVSRQYDGGTDSANEIDFEDGQLARKVLIQGGDNFNELCLDRSTTSEYLELNLVNEISQSCKNLESFYFWGGKTHVWIEAFGSRVRKLCFYSSILSKTAEAISRNCTNIRHLSLIRVRPADLQPSNLWRKIGGTLESLSLNLYTDGCLEMRIIQAYCEELKNIEIYGPDLDTAVLSKLLASYKGQLEYATIRHHMKDEELQFVVRNCRNACFDLYLVHQNTQNLVRIAGKQLDKFSSALLDSEPPPLSNGWDPCTNLRDVDLSGNLRLEQVQALFNSPKPSLKNLSLDFSEYRYHGHSCATDVQKVMDYIAVGEVTTLEYVSVVCSFPPVNAFNKLVAMNKSLSDVEIAIFDKQPIEANLLMTGLTEIVRCCFQSTALVSLLISGQKTLLPEHVAEIREIIASKYRHRRLYVYIFGEELW